MRTLGRMMQFVGLAMAPVAILLQLNLTISVAQMLVMGLAAISAFYIGRILEGYAR